MKCLVLLALSLCTAAPASAAAPPPNIILFYTDDHGYADLGIQGVMKDVKTPHVDALARSGVLARHGYSTAPQCVPSRGGLMTGKFQGRFNLDNNGSSLDGFNQETTIATRLQNAGYTTAQFGKWHLGPPTEIPRHGFKHVFSQNAQRPFSANISLDGQDRPMGDLPSKEYHIDGCSKAAASLIERYHDQPFFLYIAYRAPHTPLDAPQHYKDRFPGEMPERRRAALAMLSAIDDGVGLITSTLKKHGLTDKTLIFFMGDNGAPLKIHKVDSPLQGDPGGWDGSLNTPLNGEKGMLSEGGMHVPFVIAWPGTIPGGQTFDHPVSALDIAATAAALANLQTKPGDLDGVNLLPHLKGEIQTPPYDALYWRWTAQSAIREGHWKLLRGGDREYLYDLSTDLEEKYNLASQEPAIASRLRARLTAWCSELNPPGLALSTMAPTWNDYFDFYLEGKPAKAPVAGKSPKSEAGIQGWQARNGTLSIQNGALHIATDAKTPKRVRPFITHAGINIAGPVTAILKLRATKVGQGSISWRTKEQKDFAPDATAPFNHTASTEFQEVTSDLPLEGRLIHVRISLPADSGIEIAAIEMRGKDGKGQAWNFNH
jgi:arylsulfatase A-like enzyme